MKSYQIRFQVELGIECNDESVELEQTVIVPFLPRPGDMVVVGKHDDYREVEQIYWSEEEGFSVFLKYDKATVGGIAKMKKWGWKEV